MYFFTFRSTIHVGQMVSAYRYGIQIISEYKRRETWLLQIENLYCETRPLLQQIIDGPLSGIVYSRNM